MTVMAVAAWLGATPASIALRESLWAYPVIETVHVLAICLFVGFAALLDLRLVGAMLRRTPVTEVVGRLMPWAWGGFAVLIVTGSLLFFADPVRFLDNVFFRAKLVLLAIAGINAVLFHSTVYRRVGEWDQALVAPRGARVAGAVSLTVWAAVVITGRMIAYNWF